MSPPSVSENKKDSAQKWVKSFQWAFPSKTESLGNEIEGRGIYYRALFTGGVTLHSDHVDFTPYIMQVAANNKYIIDEGG